MQDSYNSRTPAPRRRLLLPAALLLLACVAPSAAQTNPAEPRREKLLNGLRIVLVQRPGEPQAVLRLRVHSGAAFDLADKEGTFALLGDSLFPDPSTREYVTGDLQGRLQVSTAYDSVDVTLSGRAEEFERLVELLRNAVVSAQLSPEVFTRLRDARLKTARELGVSPETVADRAIAARLYGSYPYGRVVGGTPESLARIERGDVMLARERFLTSDNATLVVSGAVDERRALRAIRQYLGAWHKSERAVPATFRRPEAADPRTLVVDLPGAPDAEIRLAARGLARTDRDAAAALVLSELVRERWLAASPELKGRAVGVRHDAYALGGTFLLRASVPSASAAQSLDTARKVLETLAKSPASQAEVESAKRGAAASLNKELESPERTGERWLDEHTYGTAAAAPAEIVRAVGAVTPSDVQRVASRLFQAGAASVAVGAAAQLRADLARLGEVELFGANNTREQAKPAGPAPLKSPAPRRP